MSVLFQFFPPFRLFSSVFFSLSKLCILVGEMQYEDGGCIWYCSSSRGGGRKLHECSKLHSLKQYDYVVSSRLIRGDGYYAPLLFRLIFFCLIALKSFLSRNEKNRSKHKCYMFSITYIAFLHCSSMSNKKLKESNTNVENEIFSSFLHKPYTHSTSLHLHYQPYVTITFTWE